MRAADCTSCTHSSDINWHDRLAAWVMVRTCTAAGAQRGRWDQAILQQEDENCILPHGELLERELCLQSCQYSLNSMLL